MRLFQVALLAAFTAIVGAPDSSACLVNWKIADYVSVVNGVTTHETNVDACYKYPALTWLNILLFYILWTRVIKVLLFATH